MTTERLPLARVMAEYKDGDEHGWETEFAWINENQHTYQRRLTESIATDGIAKPVLLGTDGRVWDGHHRIYAAHTLGLESIPVEYA